jgi:hypothetical protein
MRRGFIKPNFKSRDVEIRYNNDSVDIFATERGLKRIIAICELLIEESPNVQHQHLENQGLLTKESLKCTIRMFSPDELK